MNSKFLFVILTTFIFIYSCHSKQEEQTGYAEGSGDGVAAMAEPPVLDENVKFSPPEIKSNEAVPDEVFSEPNILPKNINKKIIKDGNISVKSDDIIASKIAIDNLIKTLNAYYESEDLQNNDQTISYNLKIRIPANSFEKLILSIENGKDEIKGKSIQARDVTEEFVDIETRLANKREYLKRYKELLAKASTVKDILAIEENIRTLQEEIESREGRLKYLSDQVSFSTLNINLYKEIAFVYKPQPQDKFTERLKKSISNGWASCINFMLWLITIWPFIMLITIAAFIVKRVKKNRKNGQPK